MSPPTEHYIDVRALPPPEPMDRALAAVAALQAGDYVRMCHIREPFPLYNMLTDDGFEHRTRFCKNRFEIVIWRGGDAAARDAALEALATQT